MATPKTYWNTIKSARNQVALNMGANVDMAQKETRAIANADLTATTILIKLLTDKGVITDAELIAARNLILSETWDEEPNLP